MHELASRIEALRAQWPSPDEAKIASVVQVVLSSLSGDLTAKEAALLHEVQQLGQVIQAAKEEIAGLSPDDIVRSHIPTATDELDAIVAHTAAATETILEVCETLDDIAPKINKAASARLQDATTRIYEACSFQDITGQRISKVVAVLKAIDTRVAQIIDAFARPPGSLPQPPVVQELTPSLLNGPQLPEAAMGQSDIDALLASFD